MSTPMTASQQLAQFDKWDVTYHVHDGWETHNRSSTGLGFGPLNGVVVHHTADDAADDADFKVCWDGRSDLPGPLCQWGLRDDGTVDLIGNGRCNHAGGGDPAVLAAVIGESYGDYPPKPRYHEGSPGATDGNVHFYGFETYYSGGHPMTAAAYATAVKICAAVCDFHGWTAKSIIGHKEWSDWKVDPGYVDMKVFRTDVAALLAAGPGGKTGQGGGTPPAHRPLFDAWQAATAGVVAALGKAVVAGQAAMKAHPDMHTFGELLAEQTSTEGAERHFLAELRNALQ